MSGSYKNNMYFYKLLATENSGVIKMRLPIPTEDGSSYKSFTALLEDGVRIKTENKWGTLVPSLESLSQISQLLDNANIISWVNGSSAAWESTSPIDVSFQMRLITFDSDSDILKQMAMLQSLTSLFVSGALTVKAHGGYKNNYWTTNDNPAWDLKSAKGQGGNLGKNLITDAEDGTVAISFGNLTISNLLVNNISANISKVLCRNNQPLWIKLDVSLRGVKALLTQDLDKMVPTSDLTRGISIGSSNSSEDKTFAEEHPILNKVGQVMLNPTPADYAAMAALGPLGWPLMGLSAGLKATMWGMNKGLEIGNKIRNNNSEQGNN